MRTGAEGTWGKSVVLISAPPLVRPVFPAMVQLVKVGLALSHRTPPPEFPVMTQFVKVAEKRFQPRFSPPPSRAELPEMRQFSRTIAQVLVWSAPPPRLRCSPR